MAKKQKPQFTWFQRNPTGILLPSTCAWSRKGCMDKVIENYGPRYTWRKLYRMGHRLIRCKLVQQ